MDRLGRRLNLHEELCEVLGSRNVYFSPPETVKIHYPCIVYHRAQGRNLNADNMMYLNMPSWDLTIIDEDVDSELPEKLLVYFRQSNNHYIREERPYMADNLTHYPFYLYY